MALPEMARRTSLLCAGAVVVAGCCGIPFFPCHTTVTHHDVPLLPLTSPQNVLTDLKIAYENRNPSQYDSLLAEGYVFRFQQSDILGGSPDSLLREQELAFALHLFQTGVSSDAPAAVKITLGITPTIIVDDPRLGHAGWKKYIVSTALRVNFANENELNIDTPAELYLKEEPAGSGLWKLAEWKDQHLQSARDRDSGSLRMLYPGDPAMGPEALFCKPMRPTQKEV